MSYNNAKSIPKPDDLKSVLLANKMWNDEKLKEVHKAELSRVTQIDGTVYWEVDHTINHGVHVQEGHDEFDTLEDAVEFYGDLAQITIYAQEG